MEEQEEEEEEGEKEDEAMVAAASMEEMVERTGTNERESERSEGLGYITRQLPDATVRANCARG